MNTITRIGLDIAKNIFVLHAVNAHGKPVKRQTLSRSKALSYHSSLKLNPVPPTSIGRERFANSVVPLNS